MKQPTGLRHTKLNLTIGTVCAMMKPVAVSNAPATAPATATTHVGRFDEACSTCCLLAMTRARCDMLRW